MTLTLFPLIQAPAEAQGPEASGVLPLYREAAWDFAHDVPLWRGGSPRWVTGGQAVATWVWNTLHYIRGSRDIFSLDWGNELQNLTGQPFTQGVKESEAVRYIRECLLVNPYITDVRQISVTFAEATLSIRCVVDTIYGEVTINAPGL